jgi:hypothetical protein
MTVDKDTEVLEKMPFNPDLHLYGCKSVASLKKEELKGLALRVWQEDPKEHFIDFILLDDVKELPVDNKIVYYGLARAYQGK